jgi:hypothetical protein
VLFRNIKIIKGTEDIEKVIKQKKKVCIQVTEVDLEDQEDNDPSPKKQKN